MKKLAHVGVILSACGQIGCGTSGAVNATTSEATGTGTGSGSTSGGGTTSGTVDAGIETLAGVQITIALQLSASTVAIGQKLTATATLYNPSGGTINLKQGDIAGRPPTGTNSGGPFLDFLDGPAITLPAGASYILTGTRTFVSTDPLGQWYAYVSLEDSNGVFHDSTRDVFFTVVAAGGTATTGSGSGSTSSTSGSTSSSGATSGSGSTTSSSSGVASGRMRAGTNNWNLGWGIYNDVFAISGSTATWAALTPPFQAGQSAMASNPWNPTFLEEMAHYDTIRYMDFVNVDADTNADWATRIQPTSSPTDGTANPNGTLAWEWIINLANRTGTNPWLNIPVYADANYLSTLATLVFANLQARGDTISVYIEWGNEDWVNTNLGGKQAIVLGNGNQTKGTVIGSTTMYDAFQTALTASGRTDIKLVRVLGGQCVNTYLTGQLLSYLSSGGADVLAIAPYVGPGGGTITSAEFTSDYPAVVSQVQAQYVMTQDAGLGLVGYEGGQNSETETSAITDDPGYYLPYGEFLRGSLRT